MDILHEFTAAPTPCHYLPAQIATMRYTLVNQITPEEYEALMDQGYRKFGSCLFKPVCAACTACRPIRVPVASFTPDRSQRRNLKLNADLQVHLGPPQLDASRLQLYDEYHQTQQQKKGWPETGVDAGEYIDTFVLNPIPNLELSVWEGDALRAVLLSDITPRAVSAIYHYHDPQQPQRGLGTFAILQTLGLARKLNKEWVYLGFYVAGCGSMEYKSRYRPCEIQDEAGVWRVLK